MSKPKKVVYPEGSCYVNGGEKRGIIVEIEHDEHGDINMVNLTQFNRFVWKGLKRGQSRKFKLTPLKGDE